MVCISLQDTLYSCEVHMKHSYFKTIVSLMGTTVCGSVFSTFFFFKDTLIVMTRDELSGRVLVHMPWHWVHLKVK